MKSLMAIIPLLVGAVGGMLPLRQVWAAEASLAARSPKDRAAQLARAEPLSQLNVGEEVMLSPDGKYLATIVHEGREKLVRFYDITNPAPRPLEISYGDPRSLAFTADGQRIWIGSSIGRAARLDLSTLSNAGIGRSPLLPRAEFRADVKIELSIDAAGGDSLDEMVLSPDGRLLAWYETMEAVGLFDLESKREIRRWQRDVGQTSPNVAFSPDGAKLVFYAQGPCEMRCLAVWDIPHQRIEAMLEVYVSNRLPGYAFADGAIYYGTRSWGPYQIRRLNLETQEEIIVDPEARAGHFIDLMPSPSGRFLVEGDFEDDGMRVYDLAHDHRAQMVGKRGSVFVGWDQPSELMLIAGGDALGIEVWSPETGEHLATVTALAARQIHRVETTADGRLFVVRWLAEGPEEPTSHTTNRYHVTVLRIPNGQ